MTRFAILVLLAFSAVAIRADDAVYEGCGTTKGCYGVPANCVATKDCSLLGTWAQASDDLWDFELFGSFAGAGGSYLALGLSDDGKMGDDSAMVCTQAAGVRQYWTRALPKGVMPVEDASNGISNVGIASLDPDSLYCSFSRDAQTTIVNPYVGSNWEFDLAGEDWFVLLAMGPVSEDGEPKRHSARIATEEAIML